jgi:two-component system, OmpR family, response regulator AdeR
MVIDLPGAPAMPHTPTVLIADDEPLFVSSLAWQFRRAGLSSISDTTSEMVLELARTQKPDLIILDINQHIDGRDLLSTLKKDPATRDIKVVVLTSADDEYLRDTCLELGAHAFELKPFDFSTVQKIARLAQAAADANDPV